MVTATQTAKGIRTVPARTGPARNRGTLVDALTATSPARHAGCPSALSCSRAPRPPVSWPPGGAPHLGNRERPRRRVGGLPPGLPRTATTPAARLAEEASEVRHGSTADTSATPADRFPTGAVHAATPLTRRAGR